MRGELAASRSPAWQISPGLDTGPLRALTIVTLVFSGQTIFCVVRERKRLWSSHPSLVVILCSIADLLIVPTIGSSRIADGVADLRCDQGLHCVHGTGILPFCAPVTDVGYQSTFGPNWTACVDGLS
jgi:hypothetical protein